MDKLISLQAAIDGFYEMASDMEHLCTVSDYVSFLESLQPEQRWIPCSERLPEHDGGLYLVTDYCKQINRKRLHTSYCYVNREGFWSDVPLGYRVIAWMPLPEPYKEGNE